MVQFKCGDNMKNKVEETEIIYSMNYNEALAYLFKRYDEEKDKNKELQDFFFNKIAEFISGIKSTNSRSNEISEFYKDLIINAAYKYIYDDIKPLRGPLMNIFGEILTKSDSQLYIEPYIDLIKIILNNRSKNY